ncbi:hypothetical protein ACQPXH_15665 [Nocardia sp. CA-135953]|uniref:hypothetical protein n=1 Tax=Nocardia sp. CA-135953 TaxID=3239978 RepID=UPI003D98BEB4
MGVLWYIDATQWSALILELERLSERTNFFGHFVALSGITGTHLWRFLTERFLTSDLLDYETTEMMRHARWLSAPSRSFQVTARSRAITASGWILVI